jgi:hypothetical protein
MPIEMPIAMHISNKITKRNIADFELSLNKYRVSLLRSIWEKHLRDKIEFHVFAEDILSPPPSSHPKYIKKSRENIAADDHRCRAYIWENGCRRQCKRELTDVYCNIHIKNRYYGEL